MAVNQRSNREKKPRGKGKPFTKGDPRINRKGRPPVKDSAELNALIDEILSEETTERGRKMDKLSAALNRLLLNKNPSGPIHILDRRFGKVPQTLAIGNDPDNPLMPKISDEQRLEEMKKLAPAIAEALAKHGVKK